MKRVSAVYLVVLAILAFGALAEGVEPTPTFKPTTHEDGSDASNVAPTPTTRILSDFVAVAIKPNILSRDLWKARKPTSEMKAHKPRYLTIHHTASPQNTRAHIAQKMRNLQQFSQTDAKLATGLFKPSWADTPYHFYVDLNGEIAEGRELKYVGDTNTPYDPTGHIQIVLEGNFEEGKPSTKQIQSLEDLLVWLSLIWEISPSQVKGHGDYVPTACPGKNLITKLPNLRERVARKVLAHGGIGLDHAELKDYGKDP